jgi:hypothetical protein
MAGLDRKDPIEWVWMVRSCFALAAQKTSHNEKSREIVCFGEKWRNGAFLVEYYNISKMKKL